MTEKFILSIDQGTTGTKVLLINKNAEIIESVYKTHSQSYPQPGWIEHQPEEIWNSIKKAVEEALEISGIKGHQIVNVGIANQGETCLIWEKISGTPLYPAIVWSCLRTENIVNEWKRDGQWERKVYDKTGLNIDSYFSATKFKWLIDNVSDVNEKLSKGQAVCGTLDSWLISKMTKDNKYFTDVSTASRTMLYNIHTGSWDEEILNYLGIELENMPKLLDTVDDFGMTDPGAFCGIQAPVSVSLVDQPAALYGHKCLNTGDVKATYGTGSFIYMNVGNEPKLDYQSSLLSSVTWKKDGQTTYSLDGTVYSAGSAIDWGKNGLDLYSTIEELQEWSQRWYQEMNFDSEVTFIPALSGLGTPYWNSEARGVFLGMTAKTNKEDMAKAILEGVAHRVADVVHAFEKETAIKIEYLNVDGKLTQNPYIMQYQANLLGIPVKVNKTVETTGKGVGYLLGEAIGWWQTKELLKMDDNEKTIYKPQVTPQHRNILRNRWEKVTHAIDSLYQDL